MYEGRHYINGEFSETGKDFSSLNPATDMEVGFFPIAQHDMVHEAVDAARCQFPNWRKMSRVNRADYFDKLAQLLKRDHERLVDAISLETGKNKLDVEKLLEVRGIAIIDDNDNLRFNNYGKRLSDCDMSVPSLKYLKSRLYFLPYKDQNMYINNL